MPTLFLKEEHAVCNRVVEVGIQVEGFTKALGGTRVVSETKERRALVVPRRTVFGPERERLVITRDRARVVPQLMERCALVDPGLDGPRMDLQDPIVRLDLFLRSSEIVKGRGEAHPSLLGFRVDPDGLRERRQRVVEMTAFAEDISPEKPRRVVLGLQSQGQTQLLQGRIEVAPLEGATRRV